MTSTVSVNFKGHVKCYNRFDSGIYGGDSLDSFVIPVILSCFILSYPILSCLILYYLTFKGHGKCCDRSDTGGNGGDSRQ